MWYRNSFFKVTTGIILVLLIILLLIYTFPFFYPVLLFIGAMCLPVLLATFLYYLIRPAVDFFDQWLPRYIAIFVVYLLVIFLITVLSLIIAPEMMKVFDQISSEKIDDIKKVLSDYTDILKSYIPISNLPDVQKAIWGYVPKINATLYSLSINLISTLASLTISLVLTPFVLYYFLKDDHLFSRFVVRYVPEQFKEEVEKTLTDIDSTLSSFILAQMIIALSIGSLLFIGYLLIGLPHAFAFALFAMIFYVIPFLGTFIAIIPALFVASSVSLFMVLKVVGVMVVAHIVESDFLTPKLMSNHLKIHPLTIILLLLAGGSLYGIIGLLLITPVYAIAKVIVWNLYKISRLRYTMAKAKEVRDELPP